MNAREYRAACQPGVGEKRKSFPRIGIRSQETKVGEGRGLDWVKRYEGFAFLLLSYQAVSLSGKKRKSAVPADWERIGTDGKIVGRRQWAVGR